MTRRDRIRKHLHRSDVDRMALRELELWSDMGDEYAHWVYRAVMADELLRWAYQMDEDPDPRRS